jgi:GNAT superfamily N-acetyltransferase
MGNTTAACISLQKVSDRSELKRFIALPHRLHADDPCWVAPLNLEQRQRFSSHNHFFEHARWAAWLALRDGEPVGRITAQVDELHLQQHGERLGFFGMFESERDPAVAAALFGAAEDWLRSEGMEAVRGPLNLHINEEIGLLVDGFDTPPSMLMGHAPPWYGELIEQQGYGRERDLLAYRVRPDFEAPRVMARLAERESGRVRVRTFRRRQLAEDAAIIREIFNDAWLNNWGFVPLAEVDWEETVRTLIWLLPDGYIQIAELEGEPVAFIVALPNLNEAIRDLRGRLLPLGWAKLLWRLKVRHPSSARVPLMGVRRSYQHSRLGPTLAFLVIDAVRRELQARGVREVEMSWILEDNDGMRNIIETIGGEAYKRYRVYRKPLEASAQ